MITGDHLRHHRRGHPGWRDTVDPDTEGTHLCRKILGHTHYRMFRRRIRVGTEPTHNPCCAGHTDNGAGAGLLHVATSMLHSVEDTIHHNVDRQLPLIGRGGRHRANRSHDTRAVEHHIDLTKRGYRGINQRLHFRLACNIAVAKHSMLRATQRLRQSCTRIILDVAKHYLGALLYIGLRGRCANPAGRTRDHSNLSLKTFAHLNSPSFKIWWNTPSFCSHQAIAGVAQSAGALKVVPLN